MVGAKVPKGVRVKWAGVGAWDLGGGGSGGRLGNDVGATLEAPPSTRTHTHLRKLSEAAW